MKSCWKAAVLSFRFGHLVMELEIFGIQWKRRKEGRKEGILSENAKICWEISAAEIQLKFVYLFVHAKYEWKANWNEKCSSSSRNLTKSMELKHFQCHFVIVIVIVVVFKSAMSNFLRSKSIQKYLINQKNWDASRKLVSWTKKNILIIKLSKLFLKGVTKLWTAVVAVFLFLFWSFLKENSTLSRGWSSLVSRPVSIFAKQKFEFLVF